MFFSELDLLTKEAVQIFKRTVPLTEITPLRYLHMSYPKHIPLMRFETHQYRAEGFGNLTTFYTSAMRGRMKLSTIVATPFMGVQIPLLLLDCMVMPKRQTSACFVEFYDCTAHGVKEAAEFYQLQEKYKEYPDYIEKKAWYIKERTPYSLIKTEHSGQQGNGIRLMMRDALRAYTLAVGDAPTRKEGLEKLLILQQRMIKEGNPSSAVLEKVLGKQGAAEFFKKVIMPVPVSESWTERG